MVYDIEFIRRVDGNAQGVPLHAISLVADAASAVIARADDLFKSLGTVPRPNGYRVREGGSVVYEFDEADSTAP